jgi:hypothetical protein
MLGLVLVEETAPKGSKHFLQHGLGGRSAILDFQPNLIRSPTEQHLNRLIRRTVLGSIHHQIIEQLLQAADVPLAVCVPSNA